MEYLAGSVEVETLGQIRRRLRYAVPAEHVGAAFGAVITRINAKTRLPGFRPGKAPAAMIERMYGSDIRRQVLDKVLKDTVFKALEKAAVRAVSSPEVEELSELKRDADLHVTVQIEVMPELELTGYEGAALSADSVAADAEDVAEALNQKAKERAEMASIEGPAAEGHEVEIDFSAQQVGSDDAPTVGQKRVVALGSGHLPEEIEAAILGAKTGDHIEKTVTAGETSRHFTPGAEVQLTITLHDVKHSVVPALDDELAKDLGFDSLDAWKTSVTKKLHDESIERSRDLQRRAAVEHLLGANTIEVPRAVVERYVDNQVYSAFGNLPEETRRMLGGYLQSLRGKLAKDAETALRRSLAVESVAKGQDIVIDDDAVEAEIERLKAQSPERADAIARQYTGEDEKGTLKVRLQHDKAMDYLVSQAAWTIGEPKSLRAVRADEVAKQASVDAEEMDDHDHDHDHDHHDHHDHDHEHGHDHDHHGHDHDHHDHDHHDHG
jgi:trigger factor